MSSDIAKGRFSVPGRLELQIVTVSAGIPKLLPHGIGFFFNGVEHPAHEVTKVFDEQAATLKAAREAHIALAAAVEKARQARREARKLLMVVRDNAVLHVSAEVVAELGFVARRPARKLTAAELSERAKLSEATRRARGTLGKAEKSRIKGSVDPKETKPETGP